MQNIRIKISRSRETIKSVSSLLSSKITASVLSAFGGILVARFLGPEETGAFRSYTIPLTYLIFLHLGTWDSLWRQIPYYVGKGMPEKVDRIASTVGAYNLILSIAVSFCFFCCAAYCLFQHDPRGVFGWLSQALYCWFIFFGNYLTSTYRTLNHFVTLSKIAVTETILRFLLVFLLPFIKFYGLCARLAVPSNLSVFLYYRNRPLKCGYHLNFRELKDLIKIGFPFSFWGNLYTSFWVATESALVLSLSGVTALGLLSVASVLRVAANAMPDAIWQVMTPRVVTNYAKDGSVSKANSRVIWVTVGLTAFMILFAISGSFLLNLLVPLFIPKYIAGIPVMKVSLWFPVVQAAFLPINTLFATGKPWLYGRSVISGIVVFALAAYLLFPLVGGLLSVTIASLSGKAARTIAAYIDLMIVTQQERIVGNSY